MESEKDDFNPPPQAKKVPPRFELGLAESEPAVITTYTMGPRCRKVTELNSSLFILSGVYLILNVRQGISTKSFYIRDCTIG